MEMGFSALGLKPPSRHARLDHLLALLVGGCELLCVPDHLLDLILGQAAT